MPARCNLCGSGTFVELPGRGRVRCGECGSLERTRVTGLLLDARPSSLAPMRVLHFAPERGLAAKLKARAGALYRAVDIEPQNYPGLAVESFDLCRDVFTLPGGSLDLIVHNHVLEHIECNYTVVLTRLAQALSEDGIMMFSVPVVAGGFNEALIAGSPAQKRAHHGEALHMRTFGRDFLQQTLGMIFRLPDAYDLTRSISAASLEAANIGQRHWRKWTGQSVFCVQRRDLRI